ncbi:CPBP family intramembrane glutamic endopeptidase [Natranaerobius thermophilus]|uniref:Abortive infection protein n=1 Tax=Natranaerobius thermophilus (strain ATCC BAA-1301 / DSM 18059 / JW/NM-WN-LF) TaxID=457570 RepID=B2A3Y1_NATTJ|nr:type II CAAX endopeptidase family protein [Natranaerobius thermophilus]ACB85083.1 Abortive infection protein [Natranaerobius thermophilus JW/NM-WN-LF]
MLEKNKPSPWFFLIGTVIWTWTFLGLTFLTGQSYLQFPTVLLSLTGGLGPLFLPLILIKLGYWDTELDETPFQFIRRVLNPATLEFKWYLYVIILVLALRVTSILLNNFLYDQQGFFDIGSMMFILIGVIIGGMEEIGWRAYALEGLQRRVPIILASLIIGFFWAIWHLPLFFMEGTYQYQLGVGTTAFWSFHIGILVGSPIYAWLYNKSGRIAFVVVLYHALGNLSGELFVSVFVINLVTELALVLILTTYSWKWMKKKVYL